MAQITGRGGTCPLGSHSPAVGWLWIILILYIWIWDVVVCSLTFNSLLFNEFQKHSQLIMQKMLFICNNFNDHSLKLFWFVSYWYSKKKKYIIFLNSFTQHKNSRVAQWKRAGPITQRSVDRNYALLKSFFIFLFWFFTLYQNFTCPSTNQSRFAIFIEIIDQHFFHIT